MFTFCFAYQAICILHENYSPTLSIAQTETEIENQDAQRFHKCFFTGCIFNIISNYQRLNHEKSLFSIGISSGASTTPQHGSEVYRLYSIVWPVPVICNSSSRGLWVTNTGPSLRNTTVHHLSARGRLMSAPAQNHSQQSLSVNKLLVLRFSIFSR